MGSTIPFGKGMEDYGGVDQSGDERTEEDQEQCGADRS